MQVTKCSLKNSMLPKLHIGLFLLSNHVKLGKFYATNSYLSFIFQDCKICVIVVTGDNKFGGVVTYFLRILCYWIAQLMYYTFSMDPDEEKHILCEKTEVFNTAKVHILVKHIYQK
jgi:hypothetical protein